MDAAEVVRGAEGNQIRGVVGASLGEEDDVVRVRRRPAAAGDLAEVPVAGEDPLLERARGSLGTSPSLYEVLRDGGQAFAGREPALGQRSRGAEGCLDHVGHADGHPDTDCIPRAHLRLFLVLQVTTQRDAGRARRLVDQSRQRVDVRMARQDARLFVADSALPQRLA